MITLLSEKFTYLLNDIVGENKLDQYIMETSLAKTIFVIEAPVREVLKYYM